MLIIATPSKTQTFRPGAQVKCTQPTFLKISKEINERLKSFSHEELSALMKTSEKLTRATAEKIAAFSPPFARENASPALFTFKGDAFSALETESYTEEELQYAQKSLLILSGLYGALRPLDLMQQYRLEMGTKLTVGDAANLYQLWSQPVTGMINDLLRTKSNATVVNLASTEYAKTIDKASLEGDMLTITFKQKSKGQYRSVPIHCKRARGMMIHFCIKNRVERVQELKEFTMGGYEYAAQDSAEDNWLFLLN